MDKHIIKFFIKSKNKDLATLSAKETIENELKIKNVISLERYDYWSIELKKNNDFINNELTKIINTSFYFYNPNKEILYWNKLPTKKIQKDKKCFYATISTKQTSKNNFIKIKNNPHLYSEIKSFIKKDIWEIIVLNSSPTDNIDYIRKEIVISSSSTQGLLANPILSDIQISSND